MNNIYMDKTIVFPLEIRSQPDRPCIKFTAYNRSDGAAELHHIFLPSPPSLSFSDAADYTTIDLGAKAGLVSAIQGEGLSGVSSIKASQVLDVVATKLPGAEITAFARKTVVNPNTNTSFASNKLRNFGFNFKLIARSKDESTVIRAIHQKFRRFTYASQKGDASNLTLDFPPVWTIRFLDFESETGENKFIPRIYSCYLTQCEATFNSDANIYFNDSAPLSVDISLQFQETRSLTRKDIENMDNDQAGNRGINEKGNPTVASLASPTKQEAKSSPTTARNGRRERGRG